MTEGQIWPELQRLKCLAFAIGMNSPRAVEGVQSSVTAL